MIVITGGQTGVDQAALRAARDAGFQTGGWAPAGWLTETGPAPWLADFGLHQGGGGYPQRTRANVVMSDFVLVLCWGPRGLRSPGTQLVKRTVQSLIAGDRKRHRPHEIVDIRQHASPSDLLVDWIARVSPGRLFIGGNRESAAPGIGNAAYNFVSTLFTQLKEIP